MNAGGMENFAYVYTRLRGELCEYTEYYESRNGKLRLNQLIKFTEYARESISSLNS